MNMTALENPFRVVQPFAMSTSDLQRYWVQSHFLENLLRPEHCFVYGPPGIGKSMLTRYLMPDVRRDMNPNGSFFGVHVPVRSKSFTQGAWRHLQGHAIALPLSEHILTSYIVVCLLEQFCDERYANVEAVSTSADHWSAAFDDARSTFRPSLRSALPPHEARDRGDLIKSWLGTFKDTFGAGHETAIQCLTAPVPAKLDHPMVSFDDVSALLRALLKHKAVTAEQFYLLFDDVDDLTEDQALALNYCIGQRLQSFAVVKCTSEHRYPTYRTMNGRRIRDPHDFYKLSLASAYTRDSVTNFEKFLENIADRRLELAGFDVRARTYFPADVDQEARIEALAQTIRETHVDPSRPYAAGDKAYRIAESEYLKGLRARHQLSTYRYAGFSTLADISSNAVRHFLTSASDMFTSTDVHTRLSSIPVQIQHSILRHHAEELVFEELVRLRDDEADPQRKRELEGLERLVLGIGMRCKSRLFGNHTERRVFSFAFQDTPSVRLQAVLDAGVQHGYFQVGTISDKEGMSRRRLYVLTRRVAPFFSLLVKSYSGYLSVQAQELDKMLDLPIEQLRGFCKDPDQVNDIDSLLEYQRTFNFDEQVLPTS